MTGTFTLTGTLRDRHDRPAAGLSLVVTPRPAVFFDAAGDRIYTSATAVTTNSDGLLCVKGSTDPGVELIAAGQYEIRGVTSGVVERVLFDAPDAGTPLDIADLVPAPADLPATWRTTVDALDVRIDALEAGGSGGGGGVAYDDTDVRADFAAADAVVLTQARAYADALGVDLTALVAAAEETDDIDALVAAVQELAARPADVTQAELDAEATVRQQGDTATAAAAATDATAKANAARDAARGSSVQKAGDTMTGPLVLSGDPVNALGAATRQYVLDRVAELVGASPAELDTFLEVFNRFQSSDSALAALTGVVAGKQPLDDDLTALAGLATQPFGRSLLTRADETAVRELLGLGSAAVAAVGDFVAIADAVRVRDEGALLPRRTALDFKGAGVTATDNPTTGRTDITIPGGSGSANPMMSIRPPIGGAITSGISTQSNNYGPAQGVGDFGLMLLPEGTYDAAIGRISTPQAGGAMKFVAYAVDLATGNLGAPLLDTVPVPATNGGIVISALPAPLVVPPGGIAIWITVVNTVATATAVTYWSSTVGYGLPRVVGTAANLDLGGISPASAVRLTGLHAAAPSSAVATWLESSTNIPRVGMRRSA